MLFLFFTYYFYFHILVLFLIVLVNVFYYYEYISDINILIYGAVVWWLSLLHSVVVITTTQLHSTKPELRLCAGSNPACGVSEIRDGEDL